MKTILGDKTPMKLETQIREQVNTARKRFPNPNAHKSRTTVEVLDVLLEPYKDEEYTQDCESNLERFKEQLKLCHRENLLEDQDGRFTRL